MLACETENISFYVLPFWNDIKDVSVDGELRNESWAKDDFKLNRDIAFRTELSEFSYMTV